MKEYSFREIYTLSDFNSKIHCFRSNWKPNVLIADKTIYPANYQLPITFSPETLLPNRTIIADEILPSFLFDRIPSLGYNCDPSLSRTGTGTISSRVGSGTIENPG
jgi:hypothetical protein